MIAARPGWREPMVWLVVALPLASVVAGIGLVVVAVRSGSADAVLDRVQRTGQIQTTDLGADARAAQLRLGAVLQSDAGMLRVFPTSGQFDRNVPLLLSLAHPQHAAADRTIEMLPDALGWHAEVAIDDSHDWLLGLSGADGDWRLHGRLPRQQRAAHLAPSLPHR